jgi:hypothetical protein
MQAFFHDEAASQYVLLAVLLLARFSTLDLSPAGRRDRENHALMGGYQWIWS